MVKNYPVEINLPVHVISNLNLFPDFFSIHIIDKLYAFINPNIRTDASYNTCIFTKYLK